MISARMVPITASGYARTATATPIADDIQMLAAVVSPWVIPSRRMMAPAPRKPTPVITPWMMRVGSKFMLGDSCAAWRPSSTNNVEPMHTSVCVRSPAGLRPICRSHPTMMPSRVDNSMGIRSSMITPWEGRATLRGESCRNSSCASTALERGRALREERGESFARVLARGQHAECAALEALGILEGQVVTARDRIDRGGQRERTVLEDVHRELLGFLEQARARNHA